MRGSEPWEGVSYVRGVSHGREGVSSEPGEGESEQ